MDSKIQMTSRYSPACRLALTSARLIHLLELRLEEQYRTIRKFNQWVQLKVKCNGMNCGRREGWFFRKGAAAVVLVIFILANRALLLNSILPTRCRAHLRLTATSKQFTILTLVSSSAAKPPSSSAPSSSMTTSSTASSVMVFTLMRVSSWSWK